MNKILFSFSLLLSLIFGLAFLSGCSDDNDPEEVIDETDDAEEDEDEEDAFEYPVPEGPLLAFPGAEGAGLFTSGGRAGDVYIVDRLDDPQFTAPPAGTLRHAVEQVGARTIVFAVSGEIKLTRALKITKGDVTIAGQTAPGDGITLRDYPVYIDADNVIVRFLRFRLGDETATEDDAIGGRSRKNNPRFYGVRDGVQRERAEIINNVIYNWGDNSSYGGEGGEYNIVNNYYKAGPATKKNRSRIFEAYKVTDYGRFYVNGNYVDGFTAITTDNWLGFDLKSGGDKLELKMESPYDISTLTILSAQDAYENVLAHAGMSMMRDAIDARIVEEVRTGTATYGGSWGAELGLIDTQATVGGWLEYNSVEAPLDTDGDGMPDAWELANGLDPENAEDGKKYILSPEYTNLEVYLNGLVLDGIGFGQ
ncbi:MAG: thrombospondin type 3 repeat-containing protein [Bacteroidales bacterium]|nr:thrombospondin type 3 repeat-containing protein [Bacteroidales bacterium]